ncbi:MAG TPA: GTPase Era [Solirubrobacterales bacterium]
MTEGALLGDAAEQVTRSGFVGLAGRPNVGKSTLVNAIVGAKVAIISDRPQTTRRAARGIATDLEHGWQMVLVDLPGVQRPRDVLTERMQRRVERELADSDVVLFVVNGEEGVGPGDRFIARTLLGAQAQDGPRVPVICAVNKCDRLGRAETAAVLAAAAELEGVDEIFPVSAKTGAGLEPLIAELASRLPEGPLLYPPEERTDAPSEIHLAELIREQILVRTRDEIPHAVEVAVLEAGPRDDGIYEIRAQVWVETESQKAILIGRGGRMIRDIGTAARRELERELGTHVFLDLRVRVRERWRRDEGLLDRLGID